MSRRPRRVPWFRGVYVSEAIVDPRRQLPWGGTCPTLFPNFDEWFYRTTGRVATWLDEIDYQIIWGIYGDGWQKL